jgi:hypothetical protein
MLANQYYYFVTGLPNIGFEDGKVVYSPQSFLDDAKAKLSKRDLKLIEFMYLPQDLDNLLKLLYNKEEHSSTLGLIPQSAWQDLIAYLNPNPDNEMRVKPPIYKQLPAFVLAYTKEFLLLETEPEYIEWETRFLVSFYELALSHKNKYIKAWFTYNRDIQNILIALTGRKYDYPFAKYLIGTGETVDKLSRSTAPDFGLGKQHYLFETLSRIFEQYSIVDRERNVDALRWRWIDNQNFFEYFNIDRILGYFCKLKILDRWITMDPESGRELFFDTLNELENSFSFPEEFDLKQKVN